MRNFFYKNHVTDKALQSTHDSKLLKSDNLFLYNSALILQNSTENTY